GNRWRQHTETNIEEAEETMEELEALMQQTTDDQLSVKINQDIERLRYAQNYYKWLMKFIRVVETGEIFDYIPKNKDGWCFLAVQGEERRVRKGIGHHQIGDSFDDFMLIEEATRGVA